LKSIGNRDSKIQCKTKIMLHLLSFLCLSLCTCSVLVFALSSCFLLNTQNYGEVVSEDDFFTKYSSGVVVDKRVNLMWSQSDNGMDLSFQEAKDYITGFEKAGYTDWRLPDIKELESLMVYYQKNTTEPGDGCSGNYVIHPFFNLTCCCPWAVQDNGTRPASYPFIKGIATGSMWHHKSHKLGNRALPVRDME
jgi:Protein of unknown function (DUF1566)